MQVENNQESVKVLSEEFEISLKQLCYACDLPAEQVFSLVEEGIIEPRGSEPARWRFQGICVKRVQRAKRLRRDLGVNLAGVALALELMDEIEQLERRVRRLERE